MILTDEQVALIQTAFEDGTIDIVIPVDEATFRGIDIPHDKYEPYMLVTDVETRVNYAQTQDPKTGEWRSMAGNVKFVVKDKTLMDSDYDTRVLNRIRRDVKARNFWKGEETT